MFAPINVKLSYCLGFLECQNKSYIYYKNYNKPNDRFFNGYLEMSKGLMAIEERTTITCQYCKEVVICLETCKCSVYYVIPFNPSMTRLFIHQGERNHPVELGTSCATIERLQKLVGTFLKFNTRSGPQKRQILIARDLLMESLTSKNTSEMGEKGFNNFLEELIPFVQNQR